MIISSIESFSRPEVCLVRVRTDEGDEGWGQTAPFNADITATVLHRQIAPHALGKDPLQPEQLGQDCLKAEYKFPCSYVRRALAGLDTALWDLQGKMEGKSVAQLLGAQRTHVPAYGSSMRRDITPKDEANRLKKLKETKGFRAFKIRIGKVCGHDQDQWPGRTEELVPTVRKAIGDKAALYVDANSCYTPDKAIEVGNLLADNGVCHFEEPCPYWELEWTAQVTRALEVPVAGGEQDCFLPQWKRIIGIPAVDIIQPDICYIGGLTRALRVAKWGESAGLPCTPHSANLSLVSVFTLHMLAAIPNAGPFMEFSIEKTPWTEELYTPYLQVEDGEVRVPEGPGWGVEINPKWLEESTYQISKLG